MDVFELRERVIADYSSYVRSFLTIKDHHIAGVVWDSIGQGLLWPDPLIQLNPSFARGDSIHQLVQEGVLHPESFNIFRDKQEDGTVGAPLRLHQHQVEGIRAARGGDSYVLTTGTGSGKSLAYIVPIVDHVLRRGSGKGVQAIVVYPMNALANSQVGELEKFLCRGYPQGKPPVTFKRYTGQEKDEVRNEIIPSPPDILLTNYVMLELLLTRPHEKQLIEAARGLRFLVLDELHTYRGRQGADMAMLVRRTREACRAERLIHVGTSATLAAGGSWPEQQAEVAKVASALFGTTIRPDRVIGETLTRATPAHDLNDAGFVSGLRTRLTSDRPSTCADAAAFLSDPLSSWIESTLGVRTEEGTGRLVRCVPRAISGEKGVAAELSALTTVDRSICDTAIRTALLEGHRCRDDGGRPVFAFRLHQFVSKGESVYASPEPEGKRHVTLQPQVFVPGSERKRALLPLAFCRECGQEYSVVRRTRGEGGRISYLPRQLSDRLDNDDGEPGFLYISAASPWPDQAADFVHRLPDAWLETVHGTDTPIVRKSQRKNLPQKIHIDGVGAESGEESQVAWWLPAPFRFCLSCGVAYDARQQSDFGKLATLGSEGRSTATTVMTLSTIRRLRRDDELEPAARKLLSFTDNRQDASLQAGHFNDFVVIALLRSSLCRAVQAAGEAGLRHEALPIRVFDALALPFDLYAADPTVKFAAKEDTNRALREVLGYYLYQDLRRGWRITSPNLEQCGLLDIDYLSLDELCAAEEEWRDCHPVLAKASAADREKVCRVLLDFFRRELAIRVSYLDPVSQESIRQLSRQRLVPPWCLDDEEKLERTKTVFPRPRGEEKGEQGFVHLSPRGGFGLYLKRPGTFQDWHAQLSLDEIATVIAQLCDRMTIAGLLHRAIEPCDEDDVPGYQLNASAMTWRRGTGTSAFHDPIRVPRKPEEGLRTNPFFTGFFQGETDDLKDLEAREHTAQVPGEVRIDREERFREARLPILFCSPTMELGVDIAQLNVVNLRNVPPTPANYAQRSGRAGRSGQPAFVYAYCSAGSPHDQYFFKRPERMVAGSVTTPRLDLGNEDLVRAHVHSIWLRATGLSLGRSLAEILDVSGDDPTLAVLPDVRRALEDEEARDRTRAMARVALGDAIAALVAPDGDAEEWLSRVLRQIPKSFDDACERWRGLYRAALSQSKRQQRVVLDPSREPRERDNAKRLRAEAESQLAILLETSDTNQLSDFYSYRYYASEGFLPGYSFPRLPLSAYLQGHKQAKGSDEFLTRPRFLAISEFGPRAFIYHEGSRYVINKVILPVETEEAGLTRRAAQCESCGYLHPLHDEPAPDLCERCGARLPYPLKNLFRMQNVSTRRRDRINSDEEERFRLGYEIKTGVRFASREGVVSTQRAELVDEAGQLLATLEHGSAATIWRMNLGWRRRKDKDRLGFELDVERGFWVRNEAVDDDPEDPLTARRMRVVPYVEDSRNCLLLTPAADLDTAAMASLEAALKVAIQVCYQLEDRELATEPLPDAEQRKHLLIYEAAEGGAGVLRRLVEDRAALAQVARTALELCHFDPATGEDLRRARRASEDCEAACYDCLLSYYNQRDHRRLDRMLLADLLRGWMGGTVRTSPGARPREDQVTRLLRLCQSELERRWVETVDHMGLRLPTDAQVLIEGAAVKPDFIYRDASTAIFVDGPVHDSDEHRAKDADDEEKLDNLGWGVIRFHHAADWVSVFARYPSLFGRPSYTPPPVLVAEAVDAPSGFDVGDFEPQWRPLVSRLNAVEGVRVEPGGDVADGGSVIGSCFATVAGPAGEVSLVDGDRDGADRTSTVLAASGRNAVVVRLADEGALAAILERIGAAGGEARSR